MMCECFVVMKLHAFFVLFSEDCAQELGFNLEFIIASTGKLLTDRPRHFYQAAMHVIGVCGFFFI
jgi:hypothetical protein